MTKIINTYLLSLQLSYLMYLIPTYLQQSFKLPCNETNRTTMTVTPIKHNASNMNNMLLPAPVPITTTTRLFYCIITLITSS